MKKAPFLNFKLDSFPLVILLFTAIYLLFFQGSSTLWSLGISMTNRNIGSEGHFTGFSNYITLLHNSLYLKAMFFTFIYALFTLLFKLVLGFVMALALNKPLKFRSLLRAVLFLPWALPTLSSVLSWRWMLGDVGGIVNYALMKCHMIQSQIGWLSDPFFARISVIAVNVWRGIPFFGISILASLQAIPSELYEVADMEGGNALHKFFYITIPYTTKTTLLVSLISTIWTLGDFSLIWLMTRGGPANATHVFSTFSYITAFQNLQLSRGVAISMSIIPFSVILLVVVMKQIFRKEASI